MKVVHNGMSHLILGDIQPMIEKLSSGSYPYLSK